MKKILLLSLLLPIIASGQQFELGVNYGDAFNAAASVRLLGCLKAGLGYEHANFRYKDVLGSDGKIKMSMPFCFVEYYQAVRKHEFYWGVDIGALNITTIPDASGVTTKSNFPGFGAHFGYSRKIFHELSGNIQIGILHYQSTTENNSGSTTTTGYFVPVTLGLHYLIGPFRKKDAADRN